MITNLLKRVVPPVAVLFALVWTGCEGSPVPLSDPPTVPVDPALVGTWEYVAEDGSGGDRARVFAFNRYEYLVEYREASQEEDGTVTYDELQRVRMFMTDVDGRMFVNVACIDCEDNAWLFLELTESGPTSVALSVVSDALYKDLEDDVTPEQVVEALRLLLREPDAVDDTAVFRRTGE